MRRLAMLTALVAGLVAGLVAAGGVLHAAGERTADTEPRHRVLVELFTSQG